MHTLEQLATAIKRLATAGRDSSIEVASWDFSRGAETGRGKGHHLDGFVKVSVSAGDHGTVTVTRDVIFHGCYDSEDQDILEHYSLREYCEIYFWQFPGDLIQRILF